MESLIGRFLNKKVFRHLHCEINKTIVLIPFSTFAINSANIEVSKDFASLFHMSKPLKMYCLYMHFIQLSVNVDDYDKIISNAEWRFENQNMPLFAEKEDSMAEFGAGEYEFKFQYRLPNNLPCSVERVGAYTRYSIKTVIDRFDPLTFLNFLLYKP